MFRSPPIRRAQKPVGVFLAALLIVATAGCRKEQTTEKHPMAVIEAHPTLSWTQSITPTTTPISFQFPPVAPGPIEFLITEQLNQKPANSAESGTQARSQRRVRLVSRDAPIKEADGTLHLPMQIQTARISSLPGPGPWEKQLGSLLKNVGLRLVLGSAAVWVEAERVTNPSLQPYLDQIAFNLGLLLPSQPPRHIPNVTEWEDALGWHASGSPVSIDVQRKLEVAGTAPCAPNSEEQCPVIRIRIRLTMDTITQAEIRPLASLNPTPETWSLRMKGEGKGEGLLLLPPKGGVPFEGELHYTFVGEVAGATTTTSINAIEQSRKVTITFKTGELF